jgi:hypothetical protein
MRDWVEEHMVPYADQWETDSEKKGTYLPKSFHQALGRAGLLRVLPGPVSWGKGNTVDNIPGVPKLPCGLTSETFDMFHEQIVWVRSEWSS